MWLTFGPITSDVTHPSCSDEQISTNGENFDFKGINY